MQDEGYDVEKDHDLPYCLHIGGQPIIHSRSFKDGFVSIQDKSSMFVAHIMNVDRHDHVLDSIMHLAVKLVTLLKFLMPEGQVDA